MFQRLFRIIGLICHMIMHVLVPSTHLIKVPIYSDAAFQQILRTAVESSGENAANVRYKVEHQFGGWRHIHIGTKTQDWRVRRRFWSDLDFEMQYYVSLTRSES